MDEGTVLLDQIFEATASACPENIEIEYSQKLYTYKAVDEIANRLAHMLQQHGVGP